MPRFFPSQLKKYPTAGEVTVTLECETRTRVGSERKKKEKKTFNSKVFLFSFVRELLNLIAVVSSFSCLTLNGCYLIHHFVM